MIRLLRSMNETLLMLFGVSDEGTKVAHETEIIIAGNVRKSSEGKECTEGR